jgi:20S proteasome alpha/beta subunit
MYIHVCHICKCIYTYTYIYLYILVDLSKYLYLNIQVSNIVIACRCSDGIVIGSDSLSVSGTLIGNRVSQSVYELGPNAVICCAGGYSDFHHMLNDLKSCIRSYGKNYIYIYIYLDVYVYVYVYVSIQMCLYCISIIC